MELQYYSKKEEDETPVYVVLNTSGVHSSLSGSSHSLAVAAISVNFELAYLLSDLINLLARIFNIIFFINYAYNFAGRPLLTMDKKAEAKIDFVMQKQSAYFLICSVASRNNQ